MVVALRSCIRAPRSVCCAVSASATELVLAKDERIEVWGLADDVLLCDYGAPARVEALAVARDRRRVLALEAGWGWELLDLDAERPRSAGRAATAGAAAGASGAAQSLAPVASGALARAGWTAVGGAPVVASGDSSMLVAAAWWDGVAVAGGGDGLEFFAFADAADACDVVLDAVLLPEGRHPGGLAQSAALLFESGHVQAFAFHDGQAHGAWRVDNVSTAAALAGVVGGVAVFSLDKVQVYSAAAGGEVARLEFISVARAVVAPLLDKGPARPATADGSRLVCAFAVARNDTVEVVSVARVNASASVGALYTMKTSGALCRRSPPPKGAAGKARSAPRSLAAARSVHAFEGGFALLLESGEICAGDAANRAASARRVADGVVAGRCVVTLTDAGLEATLVGAAVVSARARGFAHGGAARPSAKLFATKLGPDTDLVVVSGGCAAPSALVLSRAAEARRVALPFATSATLALGTRTNGGILVHVGPDAVTSLRVSSTTAEDLFVLGAAVGPADVLKGARKFVHAAFRGDVLVVSTDDDRVARLRVDGEGRFSSAIAELVDDDGDDGADPDGPDCGGAVSALAVSACGAVAVGRWSGSVTIFDDGAAPALRPRCTLRLPRDARGAGLARSLAFVDGEMVACGLVTGAVALLGVPPRGAAPGSGARRCLAVDGALPVDGLVSLPDRGGLRVVVAGSATLIHFDADRAYAAPLAPAATRRSVVAVGDGELAWLDGSGALRRGGVEATTLATSPTLCRLDVGAGDDVACAALCFVAAAGVVVVVARRCGSDELRAFDASTFEPICRQALACDVFFLAEVAPADLGAFATEPKDASLVGALAFVGSTRSPPRCARGGAARRGSTVAFCEILAPRGGAGWAVSPVGAVDAATGGCDAFARLGAGRVCLAADVALCVVGWQARPGGAREPRVLCRAALGAPATAISTSGAFVAVAEHALATSVYHFDEASMTLTLIATEEPAHRRGRFAAGLALSDVFEAAFHVVVAEQTEDTVRGAAPPRRAGRAPRDTLGPGRARAQDVIHLLHCAADAPRRRVLRYLPEDRDNEALDGDARPSAPSARHDEETRLVVSLASWRATSTIARIVSLPGVAACAFVLFWQSGAVEHLRVVAGAAAAALGRASPASVVTQPRLLDETENEAFAHLRLTTTLPIRR
ncbi:hypothetical protein M885DRAFT_525993 [Pelagophyceae sp. CCMP2097]|nr:hypothetical protein M885DRAFT_525993 [Pelagophyceae sp. CCMP2097]